MRSFLWIGVVIVALRIVACSILGCAAAPQAAEASYAAEQLRCVDAAETRAEADACREKVRERWGVAKDGGAK